jgi:hypothetical protein
MKNALKLTFLVALISIVSFAEVSLPLTGYDDGSTGVLGNVESNERF